MILFPNCKINLGLEVFDKRADGFHNIETIFYPVHWCDVLEALPSPKEPSRTKKFYFETKGSMIDGNESDNLCVKAFRLFEREFKIPPVKMCLLKNIPIGSGLGGGSSDAAFTLKLLNDLFDLKLSEVQLREFAAQLGSDCAFFIGNKPVIATGRGDELHHFELVLSSYHIIVVVPPIQVSTAWAYESVGSRHPDASGAVGKKKLNEIVQQPIENWKEELKNDFEEIVFRLHPEIEEIKNQLYDHGALYA